MTYIVPPEGTPKTYRKLYLNKFWDGKSELTPGLLVYWETEDYVTPAVHAPDTAIGNESKGAIISEEILLANHKNYIRIRTALTNLGFIGGEEGEDGAILFKQPGATARAMSCRGNDTKAPEVFLFHLGTGKLEGYSPLYRRQFKRKPTVNTIVGELTELYNEQKDVLIKYGVDPSPQNVRKLILFRAHPRLSDKGWFESDPMFMDSLMAFFKEGIPLSIIRMFHLPSPTLTSRHGRGRQRKAPKPLTAEDIESISKLPAALVESLYDDLFIVYTPQGDQSGLL